MLKEFDKAFALRAAPLFASVPAEALLPVARHCTELTLEPGEVLFAAGEMGYALYVLTSGSVRVETDGSTLAMLAAGECVGEMAVLDWESRSATVVAAEPTTLIRLERNDLMDLLADHPILVTSLAEVLADRIRRDYSQPRRET